MPIYVFVSDTDQNAKQAVNSGKWAFSSNKRPSQKKSKIGIGDRCIIYSKQSKKIFGAGVITKEPEFGSRIKDEIWSGTWYDPTDIHILKKFNNGINGPDKFKTVPSSLHPNNKNKSWCSRAVLTNNTAPSDFVDEDFKYIIK